MVNHEKDDDTLTFYAFTYKMNVCEDCKSGVTREAYDCILRHIVSEGGVIRFVYYELDSKNQYHIHGCAGFVERSKYPSYKRLSVIGFYSKWFKIFDYCGWEEYASKDLKNMLEDEIDTKECDTNVYTKKLFN